MEHGTRSGAADNGGMTTLAEAWNTAQAALPAGWCLEGLRCTSTGLAPEQRGDQWLAEACGPDGACVKVESVDPDAALAALAESFRLT
jgi:hypothetical protein